VALLAQTGAGRVTWTAASGRKHDFRGLGGLKAYDSKLKP
jgi:hypothetical protein